MVRFRGSFRCQLIIDCWLPVHDPGIGARYTTFHLTGGLCVKLHLRDKRTTSVCLFIRYVCQWRLSHGGNEARCFIQI